MRFLLRLAVLGALIAGPAAAQEEETEGSEAAPVWVGVPFDSEPAGVLLYVAVGPTDRLQRVCRAPCTAWLLAGSRTLGLSTGEAPPRAALEGVDVSEGLALRARYASRRDQRRLGDGVIGLLAGAGSGLFVAFLAFGASALVLGPGEEVELAIGTGLATAAVIGLGVGIGFGVSDRGDELELSAVR
jgi:hypothetical protein